MAVGGSISVSLLFGVIGTPTSAAVAMAALLGVIVGEAVRRAIP
jgi:membrane protease YdiL (CAAX protease family)